MLLEIKLLAEPGDESERYEGKSKSLFVFRGQKKTDIHNVRAHIACSVLKDSGHSLMIHFQQESAQIHLWIYPS